jgi:predicted acyltransferase
MPTTGRIESLDQFRGYTVAGMFVVNFLSSFDATPVLLTHENNFCSYADTIMPQFFFAVGFAFRLTFGRRAQTEGLRQAYGHVVKRLLGLALVALVIYEAPTVAENWDELVALGPLGALQMGVKSWFQTLMHIAVTSLWILPVIRRGPAVRILFAIGSALAFTALSHWFYFEWVQRGGIDGGVLGFLAWTTPTIVGTLACDIVVEADSRRRIGRLFGWGALLMLVGWLLSCGSSLYDVAPAQSAAVDSNPAEKWAVDPVWPSAKRRAAHALRAIEPPFVPPPGPELREENFSMMSQRAGTLSYHVFAAGLSLALFGVFFIVCDGWGWGLGLFRTLGTNALAAYVLHGIVGNAVERFMPDDSPGWYVAAGFLLYFGVTYLFIRKLERDGIYLKL